MVPRVDRGGRRKATYSKKALLYSFIMILPLVFSSTTGSSTAQEFTYVWGELGNEEGSFNEPWEIALDSLENVYVVDINNNRVQKFSSSGNFITSWGSSGSGEGQFSDPHGIAVDSQGFVYVTDNENRVQKFSSSGNFITSWGSSGSGEGQFSDPHGIAVDSQGFVYVTDSRDRVQKFTSDGEFVTSWGTTGSGEGEFFKSKGIAVGPAGNIYVADVNNNRIQKFSNNGEYIRSYDSSSIEDKSISFPHGVDVDSDGNIYVTDTGEHRIHVFSNDGKPIATWGEGGSGIGSFLAPIGVAVSTEGFVYVSDHNNNRVQVFSVNVDDTPPSIVVEDKIVETQDNDGVRVTYDILVKDESGPISGPFCTNDSGSIFPVGITTVTCTALDASGNKAEESFVVTVELVCGSGTELVDGKCVPIAIDETPPIIHVPDSIFVETDSGNGKVVDWEATVTDNMDPSPQFSCSQVSGTIFPVDRTSVTCTALDASGNKAEESFVVTVELVCGSGTELVDGKCVPIAIDETPIVEEQSDPSLTYAIIGGIVAAGGSVAVLASKGVILKGGTGVTSSSGTSGTGTSSGTEESLIQEYESLEDPLPDYSNIELEIRGGIK